MEKISSAWTFSRSSQRQSKFNLMTDDDDDDDDDDDEIRISLRPF